MASETDRNKENKESTNRLISRMQSQMEHVERCRNIFENCMDFFLPYMLRQITMGICTAHHAQMQ